MIGEATPHEAEKQPGLPGLPPTAARNCKLFLYKNVALPLQVKTR